MTEPQKIPVLSLKGGTGKTTTCISIARALRDRGQKVGLLDVDIHASSLPRAIGLEQPPGYEALLGGKLQPVTHDGFQLFSIGLLFKEDTPNMWEGEAKSSAVKQIATTAIDWDDLDWVLVDTPPTSGSEVQSLLANLQNIYGAVIICQPNDLAVLGITKTLNVLRETETPISGIVANMVGYQCPKCGYISNPFDRSAADVVDLAKRFKVRFLGSVPFGQEKQREAAIQEIVSGILDHKPVLLKKEKGGAVKWLLGKVLTGVM